MEVWEEGVAVVEEPPYRFRKSHRPAHPTRDLKKKNHVKNWEMRDKNWNMYDEQESEAPIALPAPNTKCSKTMSGNSKPP